MPSKVSARRRFRATSVPALLLVSLLLAAGCATAPGPTSEPVRHARDQRADQQANRQANRPLSRPGPLTHLDKARRIVAKLPLADKAGQVIVAGFGGTHSPRSLIRRLRVGGVIVMGYNVTSARQVRAVNDELRAEHERSGRSWPLLIGVDQEGGAITRVGAPLTRFPTYLTLGAARSTRLAAEVARASGQELRALGFDTVFAPVADVTSGPDDPTIGSRSAGSDPRRVATIVTASLAGYAEAGIVAVPKHFPGHGAATADSHVRLPVLAAPRAELDERDLLPFRAALGAPAVMVGHLDVRAVDPGVPSSLSPRVVDGLLRKQLGYDGIVITDGLHMGAVSNRYGDGEAAVRALRAGVDVLLMPLDPEVTRSAIVDAVEAGRLPESRLDEAATRMIAMQLAHQATAGRRPPYSILGHAEPTSYAASLAGLTVASGPCEGRLVGERVEVVGGNPSDRREFRRAAEAAGLRVGWSGDVVRLLGSGDASGAGDVVVALDAPYGLATSRASTARLALYGRTPGAFRALVDVLLGRAQASGRLPVPVASLPRSAGCPHLPDAG